MLHFSLLFQFEQERRRSWIICELISPLNTEGFTEDNMLKFLVVAMECRDLHHK